MADLLSYCKSLPKVELHAHMNGSISDSTMYKLLERKKNDAISKVWDTIAKGQKRTLDECFQMFKLIHTLVDDENAVLMVANDVVKEFAADGVVYLELRSTPRANQETGMTKTSYIGAMIKGIKTALTSLCTTQTVYVRLLLSIDRRQSIDEAMDTVLLAEKYSTMPSCGEDQVKVVGIDLSGDPRAGNMSVLLPALKRAKEKNLKIAMHLSEIPFRNDESLLLMKGAPPDRIGHGTFLHPDVGGTLELKQRVIDGNIPIEMCISSNLKTQTVPSLDKHHFGIWNQMGNPLIICTDDKGVFSTSLSEEYHLIAQTFNLTKQEVWELSFKSLNYIFEGEAVKNTLRKIWSSYYKSNLSSSN